MITIIGLGTEAGDVTARALQTMKAADKVLLRTALLPSAQSLVEAGIAFESLDSLYEKSRNFDTLAKNIAAEVTKQANGKNICYCVDGGVCEDRAAQILVKKGGVTVIEGVTKSAKAAATAGLCGKYTALSAYELQGASLSLPLVVYDLDNQLLAGDIKLALCDRFGDEAKALFLHGGKATQIALYEADMQQEYAEDCCLVVYDIPLLEKTRFTFDDLLDILRRLRAPDGCPWDRVQTHESIRINAIEEAYELVDAIDLNDPDKMCEEAGDVLMQAAFHTLIEEDLGNFNATDMLSGVCEKLITRHTHVFGTDKAQNAGGALTVWEKNKMTEKGQTTFSDSVNDVPEGFPALLRAQKVCKRASKGGWHFDTFECNEKKLFEEVAELKEAYLAGNAEEIASEVGDVLMVATQLGRVSGADCEQALLDTVKKVQARYTAFEALVREAGKDVNALSEQEWKEFYLKAKASVKGKSNV